MKCTRIHVKLNESNGFSANVGLITYDIGLFDIDPSMKLLKNKLVYMDGRRS